MLNGGQRGPRDYRSGLGNRDLHGRSNCGIVGCVSRREDSCQLLGPCLEDSPGGRRVDKVARDARCSVQLDVAQSGAVFDRRRRIPRDGRSGRSRRGNGERVVCCYRLVVGRVGRCKRSGQLVCARRQKGAQRWTVGEGTWHIRCCIQLGCAQGGALLHRGQGSPGDDRSGLGNHNLHIRSNCAVSYCVGGREGCCQLLRSSLEHRSGGR